MEKEPWANKHYACFTNRECEFFPCHPAGETEQETFNCLFCYCPLYALGERCGGEFAYLPGGVKDCSRCMFPHRPENYGRVTARYGEILAAAGQAGPHNAHKTAAVPPCAAAATAALHDAGKAAAVPPAAAAAGESAAPAQLCRALNQQLRALIHGVPHKTANLANAAALLYQTLPQLNWAGFYLLEQDTLVLGPFQGKPACIEIPLGRGVCGTAAAQNRTQRVYDVRQFPGHIACDGASNSELVIPIRAGGAVVGVLDLDSPRIGRFTPEEQAGLEEFVRILEQELWAESPPAR